MKKLSVKDLKSERNIQIEPQQQKQLKGGSGPIKVGNTAIAD